MQFNTAKTSSLLRMATFTRSFPQGHVAKGSYEFEEGEVVLIEQILDYEDNPAPEDIQPLAKDFEQFLIVAGNFDQVVIPFTTNKY